jgi:Do/DeqQ family serine protease
MFGVGFGEAARQSLEQVVHIRATSTASRRRQYDPFQEFFGGGSPFEGDQRQRGMQQQATGSGVIIRPDGYIITNNHVVEGSNDLEVSLYNKRVYKAKIVGRDPSTDLAVIKITEQGLPAAKFANSEQVQVGDWVLAVGNPFDLASTVTAGIISAKARSIHIRQDNSAIESFLQTDAAVNPGNSGGALVNLNGDLVGINTAIASPTGTYAGYAFAVPSNIVAKVVDDLLRYGEVRRAYLGVSIQDLDWTLAQDLKLETSDGVLVARVVPGSAAAQAGLQQRDVITKINNRPVRTSAELLETVATRRPGEKVTLTINRNGSQQQIPLTLKGGASVAAARE